MAQNDLVKRYIEAGVAFTQMTQKRAEAIVRDLVKAGEVQAEQTQQVVQDLIDRSRQSTERVVELVRGEVRKQLAVIEGTTREAISRLEAQIREMRGAKPAATKAA